MAAAVPENKPRKDGHLGQEKVSPASPLPLPGKAPTVRGLDPQGPPHLGQDAPFGSFHRHGSHALFADASVRFLPDSLDAWVLEAMATIAGGERVEPFDEK